MSKNLGRTSGKRESAGNKNRPGLSRRQFLGAAGAMALSAAPGRVGLPRQAVQVTGPESGTPLSLVNGRIHTMDAQDTVVSAVSIRNGAS
jgi:hypothetical protein